MSATFNPAALLYAVVEYLKSSEHVYDPVDNKPEGDKMCRVLFATVKPSNLNR